MGTDLTTLVEAQGPDGWIAVAIPVWPDFTKGTDKNFFPVLHRNYPLFSMLADVRNRTGRGPTHHMVVDVPDVGPIEMEYDTDNGGHEPLKFIDVPRGVPDDASWQWKKWWEDDRPGFHDPSWVTLAELMQAPWNQPVREDAYFDEADYVKWRDTGEVPDLHPADVGGPGLRKVTPEEYEAGVRGEKQTSVHVHWDAGDIADQNSEMFTLMAMMRVLAPDGDPNRIRLVYTFDS